jgi:hypothetical protein
VVVQRLWKSNSDKFVYLNASASLIQNEKITMTIIIIILILLLGGGGGYSGCAMATVAEPESAWAPY